MATVNGTNYAIVAAGGPPASFLKSGKWGGKVRVQTDVYEASGLASGSTITVGYLPKGAFWLGASRIKADALGSGVTLACGIAGATTKFLAATAANTANLTLNCDAVDGIHYEFTADTAIIITTGGASATGTIKTEILYSVE